MEQFLEIINKIFTAPQQSALIIITIGVMIATQAFKNIYFGFHDVRSGKKKKAIIWLFALIIGAIGGVMGDQFGKPPQPTWFWIFSGIASGGAAIGFYKLLIEVIWPRFSKAKSSDG